ncbi:hypothetical protein ACF0H5_018106 [Mactra antiquata]
MFALVHVSLYQCLFLLFVILTQIYCITLNGHHTTKEYSYLPNWLVEIREHSKSTDGPHAKRENSKSSDGPLEIIENSKSTNGPHLITEQSKLPDGPHLIGKSSKLSDGSHMEREHSKLSDGPRVCVGIDDCRCKYSDDDSVVDITSIGKGDNSPRFQDIPSPDGYLYSYNPCKPFTEFSCGKAAVCRKDRFTGKTEMIGASEMVQFTYDELTGDTVVGYTAGALANIHTFVYLMCDNSAKPGPPQMFPNGSQTQNLYILTLYAACACPGRCDADGIIGEESFPVPYIIVIVVIAVVLLYFIIGSVVMKFCKQASGREIIPNSSLWCGIVNNLKKFCVFMGRKCTRGYENMK